MRLRAPEPQNKRMELMKRLSEDNGHRSAIGRPNYPVERTGARAARSGRTRPDELAPAFRRRSGAGRILDGHRPAEPEEQPDRPAPAAHRQVDEETRPMALPRPDERKPVPEAGPEDEVDARSHSGPPQSQEVPHAVGPARTAPSPTRCPCPLRRR